MTTGYIVGDVMSADVQYIELDATIIKCAQQMAEKKIGSLIILENNKPIGIITEQDLARKVLAKGINPLTTFVREIMSKKLESITPEKDIYHAVVLMGEKRIKHLPVLQDNKLLGIISSKDIIRVQPSLVEKLNFKNTFQG